MPFPNIPSIPSAPTSMSETETDDERRRILEGIFAEEDDDDDDDDEINSNSGSMHDDEANNNSMDTDDVQDATIVRDDHACINEDSNATFAGGGEWSTGTTPVISSINASITAPSVTAAVKMHDLQLEKRQQKQQQQQQQQQTSSSLLHPVSIPDNTYFSSSSDEDDAEEDEINNQRTHESNTNQEELERDENDDDFNINGFTSTYDSLRTTTTGNVLHGGIGDHDVSTFSWVHSASSEESGTELSIGGRVVGGKSIIVGEACTTSTPCEQEDIDDEAEDAEVKVTIASLGVHITEDSNDFMATAHNDQSDNNAHDDDFFAKADHTVIDEIFNEDPDSFGVDTSSAVPSSATTSDTALPPPPPPLPHPSQSPSKSCNSTTNATEKRSKDKISFHTTYNAKTSSNNMSNGNSARVSSTQSITSSASSTATTNNNNNLKKGAGGLPDVLSSMRQKIESFNIFEGSGGRDSNSDKQSAISYAAIPPAVISNTNASSNAIFASSMNVYSSNGTQSTTSQRIYYSEEERDSMRRTFQQCISAAVLVSLAHKRYERRRLAAMEIEKVVRTLAMQDDFVRVRAILLSLSDDYIRSTNEDARKGGAVALAACAIGLKKANDVPRGDNMDIAAECRDLILASVVHACQDHSQRVRYYATESLFNVIKVVPVLAIRHFFVLFEILRSLYADVDLDVRSGAELLDKKLKEVIVGAINSGSFSADACVPVFARFVYMRNKATKQLTLTWLREFSEKLVGAPILEFLHLFLEGVFVMVADPNATIRQLALEFLQSVLPKLLVTNEDFEDAQQKVDFDKILQSLVLTMEHPDPFVRKVAMYWMSRIVQAHMTSAFPSQDEIIRDVDMPDASAKSERGNRSASHFTAASVSVRNALPHILPGILLSIGDTHQSRVNDPFLPDQTTHSLAEQANTCLQDAVRRDGQVFIPHLGGFIVALREELDSPGGLIARNPPPVERRPYRMDVKADGTGIESTGWFRASDGVEERDNALILSRLCALQWVVVLYEYVVPTSLKADYASEFIDCILYQLVDQPPGIIVVKSFEVLAKISNSSDGVDSTKTFAIDNVSRSKEYCNAMDEESAAFALGILEPSQKTLLSRDRSVFASLIDLHSRHQKLLIDLSKVIELMCTLQPAEFVFLSFAIELDSFVVSRMKQREKMLESLQVDTQNVKKELASFAKDLAFVSNFAQQLGIVLLSAPETEHLREALKLCIGSKADTIRDKQRATLFHILLHTFSHNIVATLAFCLWGGAFVTASTFLQQIDPLDLSLMFFLELDQLVELIERPLFRHLHLRMLECEDDPHQEGSGAMLFRTLKSIMMILPQSTSYSILKERLTSMARYRQSAVALRGLSRPIAPGSETDVFVSRVLKVRRLHCDAKWRLQTAESLEEPCRFVGIDQKLTAAQQRREWVGYADEEEEVATKEKLKQTPSRAEMVGVYEKFSEMEAPDLSNYNGAVECEESIVSPSSTKGLIKRFEQMSAAEEKPQWREYWTNREVQ